MASGLFSNVSPWHIPAMFMGTAFTLGGLLPLRAPDRAMREYGLPEGIVRSEPAQLAFGIYGTRVAAYGVALWTFYLRGEYHVVDTLMSLLFLWGAADCWICIKAGVPRTAVWRFHHFLYELINCTSRSLKIIVTMVIYINGNAGKAASQETPARTPSRTPNRRAISAEPFSGVHTPLDRSGARDLRASLRRGTPASAGRSNAPTPHAKAARRLLDQRRTAMFTPGKKRRQSMLQQRETPLDILRMLGRTLAPKSQPIHSSSSSSPGNKRSSSPEQREESNLYDDDDDEVDDLLTRPPIISLPLDIEDASSTGSDLPPPTLSQLDEDNFTMQSIEMPRRIANDSRLSRGSPGSERMSDYFNNEATEDDIGQQSDFFPGLLEDLQARAGQDDMTLEPIEADQTRQMTEGRGSDFNFEYPGGLEDGTVFQMSDPANDLQATSPIVDPSVAEAVADDAQDPRPDVMYGSDSDAGGGDFGMDGWDYNDAGVDDHSSINEEPGPIPEPTVTTGMRHEPADDRLPRGLKAKKRKRVSQHGIEYPSLPPAFVKRVAQTALQSSGLSNQRLSAETLDALIQSSEWFFEQLGDDLGAYADHAKRRTIEESDVFTLMKRNSNIVQATSDRTAFLHVLLGTEAPPKRAPPGAEDASSATR
ncbi:centromere kinetochore component CENP-T-domain-containing protein [Fusarium oxysporum Fo47]|uniref:centromere kinetochore component CENP-T-domain-containing protein n=1 Tax=Fusarium oxysporum Fo47 TaxID=660027 RepID=UPI002869EB3F|nr:centromere kinetochore component CENP-T-domain-containing protein [Fusarium oxysporum Fo47]WJG35508.1 centromere kinetochore component CENP-T-domain-containing protein [Fusarium oxysporum Fo47]